MNPPKDTYNVDLNNDGVITEEELRATSDAEKMDAQRSMAWIALISMLVFTALVFLPIFPDSRIKALADLFSLFYIGMAGVVGAYMGASVMMSKKK